MDIPIKCASPGCYAAGDYSRGMCRPCYYQHSIPDEITLTMLRNSPSVAVARLDEAHKQAERFPERCAIFERPLQYQGYGVVTIKQKTIRAHRASYMLHHGIEVLDSSQNVLHKCGTHSCVNPHHLYVGSQSENARDTVIHGRSNWTQIDLQMARDIKRHLAEGNSVTATAAALGVSYAIVYNIHRGKTWHKA